MKTKVTIFILFNKTYILATNVFMKNVDEVLKNCPVAVNLIS